MLKEIIDEYMQKVPVVKDYCKRCLETKRWSGSIVLMVLDAAFTSVGLNYFQIVVPSKEVEEIWKNKRSWKIAKSIASYLVKIKQEKKLDDKRGFCLLAKHSRLENRSISC